MPGPNRSTAAVVPAAAIALAAACLPAIAQDYPAKPIRMVVPFAPGGNTDIIARAIAPGMAQDLGQPVIIENRGGAGSTLGTAIGAKAPPDGYTLLMVSSAHVINPAVRKSLPYDSVKDFAPVTLVADVPNALAVHPSVPVKDVRGLIAFARKRPGELTYATPGAGTSSHLAVEMLAAAEKLQLVQIPYKGVGPATADVVGGPVHVVLEHAGVDRARQGGPVANAGPGWHETDIGRARRADHDRGRLQGLLRIQRLRHVRARRHAAADHRSHQRIGAQGARRPDRAQAAGRAGCRAGR